LCMEGVVDEFYFGEVGASGDRGAEVVRHLESARIILLLVSADFLAALCRRDDEVVRAMERHEAGTARVIPGIVRPGEGWYAAPFGKLPALPGDDRPVTTWGNRDAAYACVSRGVSEAARRVAAGPSGLSPVVPGRPEVAPALPPGRTPTAARAAFVRRL